ncbi:DUF4340 domain-containing protein [Leptospira weilii]|uniref:PF14238 domain protein n=2 Tax=Leptospira weilii TaxID=28184 RepID=M6Q7N5_9LEPT|nr:DUF4340 domain-containing protein [Leptospira weilii]EMN88668.1 PF14238 domain protein [Leptospira weilii str. UI 13098]OMI16800.1 hypothetical protein BUQ74_13685 [Leptospira weilii serovar Heyan]QDK24511.1 DUF4340 domain-containing protein [Leptospira weilii]QDK28471.1 DUF4340 domain-containing protein [Leptospira weilii]
MKRTLLLLFTLVALALSFFFLEEKKEDQSEISVWEIDIDEIEYQPPKNSWEGEDISAFYRMPIVLKKQKDIRKNAYFLTVHSKDSETGETLVFEGGYNAENIFREFSVLKAKGVEPIADGKVAASLQLNENSPQILLKSSGKLLKKIWIGKKKSFDSTRIVREGNEVLIVQGNTSDRFTRGIGEFRQKQLVNLRDESIVETIWEEEGKTLHLDNHPYKDQTVKKNFWRRLSGKPISLEQSLGNSWNNQVISQLVELYPDDPNGAGYAVAKSLTNVPADASLKIRISNDDWITLRYYPKTNINSIDYRPTIRIINGKFSEPPFYIREDSFLRLKEVVGNLEKAEQKKEEPANQNSLPKNPNIPSPQK